MDSKTVSLVLRLRPVREVFFFFFFNEAASNKFLRGSSGPMKFAAQVTCAFAIVRRAGCVPWGGCAEHLRYLTAPLLEDAKDAAFTG